MIKNKKKLILTAVIIFALSLGIEIFVFNSNFFIKGDQKMEITNLKTENLMILGNGHYKIISNEASIQLENVNQYINILEFDTDSFRENVNIQISYNDKIITDNINAINMKSIYINEYVNAIKITFVNENGQEIMMDNFKGVNYFQFNPFRLLLVLSFFVIASVICYTILNKGNVKLEFIFLILVLCFGFLNTVMTPIFYSWDEAEHFIKAYNLANNNLVMRQGETISYPKDLQLFFDKRHQIENPNYRTFKEYSGVTQKLLTIDYSDTEMAYYPSSAITYTLVPYIFSSIGIRVGKVLSFPFLITFYLGRFFNLLLYALLGFFSIKMIPNGKKLLFVCALLPTIVFQAASYSADVVINGFSLFVFALIMSWLFEEKKLKIVDLLLMCCCFIFITASKMAYVPIFLLVLILKQNNFIKTNKQWIIKFSVLLLGCVTFLGVFIYGDRLGIAQWIIPGVDVKAQLEWIIYNPIKFIGVLIRTIMTQEEYLLGGATVSLAYIGYLGRDILVILYFMLGVISLIDTEEKITPLKRQDKGVILLFCISTFVLSAVALYATFTPLENNIVLGFQGRYLIPLIFPFLFLFQRKTTFTSVKSEAITIIAVIFSVCTLFYTAMHIYNLYYI